MKRLIFYLFIFSQFIFFIDIFAEKYKKESSDSDSIKWEKIKETKSNKKQSINKILWKSYKGDEIYFQNTNDESYSKTKIKGFSKEKNPSKLKKELIEKFTEVEPFLPLNNFLDFRKFQIMVRWKSSFDGGVSGGTGQQNPSFVFDYGLSESSLLSVYVSGADDDLYNLVGDQKVNYYWQSYAVSLKQRLIDEDQFNFGLSIVTTIEYWRHASGSETSKSIYNQRDNSFGKD